MKRIAITLSLVAVFSALAYYVLTHPDLERVEELEQEFRKLKRQNDKLAEKNQELRRRIVALREDPRLAERQARARGGLARPDELVVQFEGESSDDQALQVEMTVEPDRITLAGEQLAVDHLAERLETMAGELPAAKLTVKFDDEVGPLRKERVIGIVDESQLAPAQYRDAD